MWLPLVTSMICIGLEMNFLSQLVPLFFLPLSKGKHFRLRFTVSFHAMMFLLHGMVLIILLNGGNRYFPFFYSIGAFLASLRVLPLKPREIFEGTPADPKVRQREITLAQDAAAQLDLLCETVPALVCWISFDLKYLRVNHHFCRLFDVSESQARGALVGSFGEGEYFVEFVRRIIHETGDGSVPFHISFEKTDKDLFYALTGSSLRQDDVLIVGTALSSLEQKKVS